MFAARSMDPAKFERRCFARVGVGLLCALNLTCAARVNVLTYHNDQARTGQNLQESVLTPANVNSNAFGKQLAFPVDGYVYAQPLYISAVPVPGRGLHNLVIVATEHDSVYAFDADGLGGVAAGPVWQRRFIDPANGITTVPVSDFYFGTPPEFGITGTPVIDPNTLTLYVAEWTKISGTTPATYAQHLHALDVGSGAEKPGSPVLIQASIAGGGDGSDGNGMLPFDAFHEFQRPGLLLVNGIVYVGFASAGDIYPFHGWLLGYDAQALTLTQVFNSTPDAGDGGIWMSGAAPAADGLGNIFLITGNGAFDANAGGRDYGDCFLKLTPVGNLLLPTDYFAPWDQAYLDANDGDLGSGGAMLLPDSAGSPAHPHLVVGAGKTGMIYLLDRDNLGHYHTNNDDQIVQAIAEALPSGELGAPAFYNNWIYYQGIGDVLKAYAISNAQLSLSPVSSSTETFGFPGSVPSISANGNQNAIAWVLQADAFDAGGPGVLHAYNATNLAEKLYDSSQAGDRDQMGLAQKFSVPTIANGRVYTGTGGGLLVFGHYGAPTFALQPFTHAALAGDQVVLEAMADGTLPIDYQWLFNGTNIPNATNVFLELGQITTAQAGLYTVTATNSEGMAVSMAAAIGELAINHPIPSITAMVNVVFSLAIPSDLFLDPDPSQSLSIAVVGLPAGLLFDELSHSIQGTPAVVGGFTIQVVATDRGTPPLSATNRFQVTILDTNHPPVVVNPIPAQTTTVDQAYSFTLPANIFADRDTTQSLEYVVSGLPAGLLFDLPTLSIQGTPQAIGAAAVQVVATDNGTPPLSATNTFPLTILDTNHPPVLVNPLPVEAIQVGQPFSFALPMNTFSDPDAGQNLRYAVSGLPAGLLFNLATQTIEGTPQNTGTAIVQVVATDDGMPPLSATNNFELMIFDINRPPVAPSPSQTRRPW